MAAGVLGHGRCWGRADHMTDERKHQNQALFWFTLAVLLILAVLTLQEILLPFVAGLVIAYALNPVADRIERLGLGRLLESRPPSPHCCRDGIRLPGPDPRAPGQTTDRLDPGRVGALPARTTMLDALNDDRDTRGSPSDRGWLPYDECWQERSGWVTRTPTRSMNRGS